MSEERYVKQIVSDVMEMAAKIKFLEAKVAASESWNAECADDHKRELDAALRRAKAEGLREAQRMAELYPWSRGPAHTNPLLIGRREGEKAASEMLAKQLDARAAQIEQGEDE